jgi:hypothetical protein
MPEAPPVWLMVVPMDNMLKTAVREVGLKVPFMVNPVLVPEVGLLVSSIKIPLPAELLNSPVAN